MDKMTHEQLLEIMADRYAKQMELGFLLTGTKEGAIEYANETSAAGQKAKQMAMQKMNW